MTEDQLRADIVRFAKSLFDRSYTAGSSGNISVKLEDGFIVTPTNACMGFLDPDCLTRLDKTGTPLSGDKPTKELPLHFAMYKARPTARAVVHLHSTYATLLSCLEGTDPGRTLAPITPYAVMRLGDVPMVPYTRPGADTEIPHIEKAEEEHPAVLIGNHGPEVSADSLEKAVFASEELKDTAKPIVLAGDRPVRLLDQDDIDELNATFRLRG
ncbi:aldolase [Tropicimonas sp. IMCC34043]|uniref:3-oxo-tetronate 4-phosphate decarboxylase n=1 Tax=Tropicimonas sp. IMCC34043 TaxID=2248760 RepID=UPI000E239B7D|nr:aldolase [Tropicimonas sp. IMCC34043]